MKARIKFRKYGVMRFIGHLDVMRFFQKAMRRADIPIAFTGGYSPHMIMSFAQPLGVGVTSDGEYLDIELQESIASGQAVAQLNAVMVEGIEILSFLEIPDDKKCSGMTIVAAAGYEVWFLESAETVENITELPPECGKHIRRFLLEPEITVLKKTKRSEREVNIRPMIYNMSISGEKMELLLAAGSEENLKPDLVMDTFLKYSGLDPEQVPLHYHRTEVYARAPVTQNTQDPKKGHPLVSLESLGRQIL